MRRIVLAVMLFTGTLPVFAYSAAELVKPGTIHGVALSPSGRYIAIGIGNDVGITDAIAILDVQRDPAERLMRRIPLATPKGHWIVSRLSWASDQYLLAMMNHAAKEPVADPELTAALYSIRASDGAIKPYDALLRPVRVMLDGTPDARFVYLTSGPSFAGMIGPRPYEVELATGSARLLATPDTVTQGWRIRDGRAVVKFNFGKMGEVSNIFASESAGDAWTLVNTFRYPADRRNHLEVIAEAESPLEDFMRKTRDGADVDGIHLRDLRTMQLVAKVFELPGHDVVAAQFRQRKFIAATVVEDTRQTRFADETFRQHYAGLEKYFGTDASIQAMPSSTLAGAWLLHVSGPRNPGEYHFYDPERRHVEFLGAERPWLESERLAPSVPLAITARDGTPLRAYLTCPARAVQEKRPLIVMPPGGPWTYGYLRFNAYAQAFAARGWCVVEPNVRGTYGRGRAFQALGFGQWNGSVADDVADTVEMLVRNGTADPGRVAGYGEYLGATALLAAEVKQPALFKAIVAFAPVVDGQHVLRSSKGFGRSALVHEDWNQWLGALGESSALRKQLYQVRTAAYLIHPSTVWEIPLDATESFAKALGKAGHAPQTSYPGYVDGKPRYAVPDNGQQLQSIVDFLSHHLRSSDAH